MKNYIIVLATYFVFGISINAQSQIKVKISGKVLDRKSDTLLLSKVTASIRDVEKIISIPIRGDRFNYEMEVNDVEAYQLVFKDEMDEGAWKPIIFFPDTNSVLFSLSSMDLFENNEVVGGKV